MIILKKATIFQRIKLIISIVFISTGIILGLIPFVVPVITQGHQNQVIDDYKESVSNLSEQELSHIKEEVRNYNGTGRSNYYNALDDETVISYIEIPKIDVYLPIYKGSSDEVLERGVGMLEGASYPIGGDGTHCVLTAHSGLVTQKMFTDLEKLTIGDYFCLHTLDEELYYKVFAVRVLLPEEVNEHIVFEKGHDYCSLMTCTPVGINTHRIFMTAKRMTEKEVERLKEQENTIVEPTTETTATVPSTTVDNNIELNSEESNGFFKKEYIICAIISIALEIAGIYLFIKTTKEISRIED